MDTDRAAPASSAPVPSAPAPPASGGRARASTLRRKTILFAATQAVLLIVLCAVSLNTLGVLVTIEGEMEEVSGVSTLATLTVSLEKVHGDQILLLLQPQAARGADAAGMAAFDDMSREIGNITRRMLDDVHQATERARQISPMELAEAEERGGNITGILADIGSAQSAYERLAQHFLQSPRADAAIGNEQMVAIRSGAERVETELGRLLPYFARNIELALADTRAFERRAREIVYVVGGFAILATLLGALHFARSLTIAVRRIGAGVSAIVGQLQGHRFLHQPMPITSGDELGLLGEGVNALSLRLSETLAERDAAQEGMRQARDHALDAARAKSQFLAMMSHEIRTPMNGIIGMTELLLEEQLTPEQHEFASTVRACGDHLLVVINDILDFSKIEAGKLELEQLPFMVRSVVEDAAEIVAVRACERGIELVVQIDESVPETVLGDPGRIRQVLINLLGNAVKFTDHGEVVVSVTQHAVGTLDFAVRDTGIGMSDELQQRLFQPFSQGDTTTTRKYGGTGLGLAICVRLVTLMGGTIAALSKEGSGSLLSFSLPLPTCAAISGPAASRAPADLTGRRVLCVDDNSTNRAVLERQTRAWGMTVSSAKGGLEAVVAVQAAARAGQPFDVVLLDMEMPGMDGLEVAAALQHDPLTCGTVLIMLSSLGHGPDRETADAVGLSARLVKPTRANILRETIGRLIDGAGKAPTVRVPRAQAGDGKLRALVIEDNLVNQKVAVRFLARLGIPGDVAPEGREGLRMLALMHYDLVLMDCLMPVMDGFAATRSIRESETREKLPRQLIIAMTANAMAGDRELCLQVGMDDYLSKPLRLEETLATLTRWFPEHLFVSQTAAEAG